MAEPLVDFGNVRLSLPATSEILRRAEYEDALDPLAVEMREVPRVAGQKIISLAVNRGQQNWLVLLIEANVYRKFETLRRIDK